jgi:hypothetical protein
MVDLLIKENNESVHDNIGTNEYGTSFSHPCVIIGSWHPNRSFSSHGHSNQSHPNHTIQHP